MQDTTHINVRVKISGNNYYAIIGINENNGIEHIMPTLAQSVVFALF